MNEKAIKVTTPQSLARDAEERQSEALTVAGRSDEARAMTEVKARLIYALERPRDERAAEKRITAMCRRISFAEKAAYIYKRGQKKNDKGQWIDNEVTGATIQTMTAIASAWGNLDFGFRVLNRLEGKSEIESYAWDLETNTIARRSFLVSLIRERKSEKGGDVELSSDRDKYELEANMAQRRVRACLEQIIPKDIRDQALMLCEETVEAGDGTPWPKRLEKLTKHFESIGVSTEAIEKHLGHRITAMTPKELVQLGKIANSIRDGQSTVDDFFRHGVVEEAKPKEQMKTGESTTAPATLTPEQLAELEAAKAKVEAARHAAETKPAAKTAEPIATREHAETSEKSMHEPKLYNCSVPGCPGRAWPAPHNCGTPAERCENPKAKAETAPPPEAEPPSDMLLPGQPGYEEQEERAAMQEQPAPVNQTPVWKAPERQQRRRRHSNGNGGELL
jgi:hypothetical protein